MSTKTTKADVVSPNVEELRRQERAAFDDPSGNFIASDRVEGTRVYRPDGERIGRINHFMVNKRSGKAEFAVMSFGGFLGLGDELRPVPWDALEYSNDLGGYVVSADDDTFRNSPFIEGGTAPDWDSSYAQALYGYWRVPF
ncbi:PRC-barrel domain-containing protein [Aurantiacibacter zhengii]|uniref:PRC-barrel domain containing protein n=1 Tax=Aurantiacibacter zhengii TaxID=2307003 RepID=A0A418NQ89_9SPHN|nr:PRC-barrel domain-containing protein [Aurantiacibacter zhengii]RIV84620.1 PRC-barrel domain containing protein [Aurantiacibacter zhengii]